MRQSTLHYSPVYLRPHPLQFVVDELPCLLLCSCGIVYAGIEEFSFRQVVLVVTLAWCICLLYRFIYLRKTVYQIGTEQMITGYGIFERKVDYLELYRVVDYYEYRTFMQQLVGLKTVVVYSMDRSTPRLEIKGVPDKIDLVAMIRERVELNKQRRRIYEVTNQQ